MKKALMMVACAAAFAAALAGSGGNVGAAVADRPKSVFDAMTDEDRAFYAKSFTSSWDQTPLAVLFLRGIAAVWAR